MTNPTQQSAPPPSSADDGKERQNQGIPYILRRIQIIDGVILAAIIAVFSAQRETDDKVDQLLAEKVAEEKVEVRDPPIRRARYEVETNAIREHVRAVDGRVTELEKAKRTE